MRIRPGTVDDAAGIARVHVDSWRAAYRGLMPDAVLDGLSVESRTAGWGRFLRGGRDGHTCLVAVDETDAVLAWATFGAGRDQQWREVGELAGFYAHPDVWSTGVGHALLTRVERDLAAGGFTRAYLWVLDGNERAQRFYARHGWAADGGTKHETHSTGQVLREVRFVTQHALA